MGTIGGNLCLDTRCTYYDQNYEWRKSIDFCMKKDGQTCWVATSSPKCLAVSSTDTAPMLQALGASVTLVSARGQRVLPVVGSLRQRRHALPDPAAGRDPDRRVALPPSDGWRSAYWKLRRRGSFDFPVAAAAVAARLDGRHVADDPHRARRGRVAADERGSRRGAAHRPGRSPTKPSPPPRPPRAKSPSRWTTPTSSWSGARRWSVRWSPTRLHEIRGDDMRAMRHRLARQERLSIAPGISG